MRSIEPQVTEGPRADILACVHHNPGAHLRGIERMTGLPLGQVLYHLDRLERMGLLASTRDCGFRRYFATGDVGRSEKKFLAALRHEVPRRILLALLERPYLSHKELQARLGVAGSTLSFHLQRLLAAGVLHRERAGVLQAYAITEPEVTRAHLLYYGPTFQDSMVDRFVRRALWDLAACISVEVPLQEPARATPTLEARALSS